MIDINKIIALLKKEKRAVILGVAVLLVLIISLSIRPRKPKKRAVEAVTVTKSKKPAVSSRVSPKKASRVQDKRKEARKGWGRDPFALESRVEREKPEEGMIRGKGEVRVEGIVWSDREPFALINGRIVKRGDSITKDKFVEDILPNRVIIRTRKGVRKEYFVR